MFIIAHVSHSSKRTWVTLLQYSEYTIVKFVNHVCTRLIWWYEFPEAHRRWVAAERSDRSRTPEGRRAHTLESPHTWPPPTWSRRCMPSRASLHISNQRERSSDSSWAYSIFKFAPWRSVLTRKSSIQTDIPQSHLWINEMNQSAWTQWLAH